MTNCWFNENAFRLRSIGKVRKNELHKEFEDLVGKDRPEVIVEQCFAGCRCGVSNSSDDGVWDESRST